MKKVIKKIDLGCLPLTVLGKEYMNAEDMGTIITDISTGAFWFEEPFNDLKVVISHGARLSKEFTLDIPEADTIADIVIPVAKGILNNVYDSEEHLKEYGVWRRAEDFVFETIHIYEDGTVDISFGT